jgi:hypothetical protein
MQGKNGFASVSDDMDVRRTMIIEIDDHAQAPDAENRRHAVLGLP